MRQTLRLFIWFKINTDGPVITFLDQRSKSRHISCTIGFYISFGEHILKAVGKITTALSLISSRKELTDLLRKLKDAHGKSLSGLTFDEIVYKISQFIDPKRAQVKTKQNKQLYLSAFFHSS